MKNIFVVLFCLGAVLLLSGCIKQTRSEAFGQATDSGLEDLKKRGVFVLGHDGAFPPLTYLDNGNAVGYDIDLAKEVCRRLGLEFQDKVIVWTERDIYLNSGAIDCLWTGFTITEERKKIYAISNPYLQNTQVIVVPIDSKMKSVSDMQGKRVGYQGGSTAEDAFKKGFVFLSTIKEMVPYEDLYEVLDNLSAGNVDVAVMDSVIVNSIIQSGGKYKIVSVPLAAEEYGIAFRKEDVSVRNEVQRTLNLMQVDGTVAKISEKWFGADVSIVGK